MEFLDKSKRLKLQHSWVQKRFYEPRKKNYIKLCDASSIVRLGFIAHRSINHLDLSICENPRRSRDPNELPVCKGSIITQEDCRKVMIPKRKLLYRLHLDCSRKLETHLKIIPFSPLYLENLYNLTSFHLKDILLPCDFYLEIIRQFISETIKNNAEFKIIRKLFGPIKIFFGNLTSVDRYVFYLILHAVYKECNDSKFVKEVLSAFNFKDWLSSGRYLSSDEELEFFLIHGRNVGEPHYFRGDLINACMTCKEYSKVVVLLKYIDSPLFMESDYENNLYGRRGIFTDILGDPMFRCLDRAKPAREGLISKQRNLQALLILDLFGHLTSDDGIQALRSLWRAVPDIFFTLNEWMDIFGSQLDTEILQKVDKFYSEIIEEDTSIRRPRSLRQYCRVTLRKALYECQNLPNGIEMLNLDPKSKAFLRLEI